MSSSVLYVLLGLLGLLGHGLSAAIEHVRLRHDNYHCFDEKPKLENGYYEVLRDDGHVIRAYCNQGFSLVGDTLRICDNSTKRFSGDDPKCQDLDECLDIGDRSGSEEGSAVGADTHVDDEDDAPVPCHPHAQCINTPGSYQCQCQAGYHGDGYRCTQIPTVRVNINRNTSLKVECHIPDPPEHGFIHLRGADVIRFYCHPDYSIHGNSVTECTNGTWSSPVPRCVPGWNTCGDPGIPDNGYRIGNRFSSGNVVRYRCRQAYKLVGPRFRICTAGADEQLEWTSVLPNCTRPPPADDFVEEDEDEEEDDDENVDDVVLDENDVRVGAVVTSGTTDVVVIPKTTTTTTTSTTATTTIPTTTQSTTTTTSTTATATTTPPPTTTTTTTTAIDIQSSTHNTTQWNITEVSTTEMPQIGIEIVEQVDDPVVDGLLQKNCGEPTKVNDQISWPWLVDVHFRGAGSGSSSDTPLCRGVLVCSDWVLTAASCLQTSEEHHARLLKPYDVFVAFEDKDWDIYHIIRHPGYFMNTHGDNLALIMLKMSPEEKRRQMPVCLIRNTALGMRTNAVLWDYPANTTSPVHFLLDDECTKSTTASEDSICTDIKSPLGAPLLVNSSTSSKLLSLFGLATSLDSAIYTTVIRQVNWVVQTTEACEL